MTAADAERVETATENLSTGLRGSFPLLGVCSRHSNREFDRWTGDRESRSSSPISLFCHWRGDRPGTPLLVDPSIAAARVAEDGSLPPSSPFAVRAVH